MQFLKENNDGIMGQGFENLDLNNIFIRADVTDQTES